MTIKQQRAVYRCDTRPLFVVLLFLFPCPVYYLILFIPQRKGDAFKIHIHCLKQIIRTQVPQLELRVRGTGDSATVSALPLRERALRMAERWVWKVAI